jgi:hypothetical protein
MEQRHDKAYPASDDNISKEGRRLVLLPQRPLMRFNPGIAHVCGILIHGALVGSSELDGDHTKAEGHWVLPKFGPLSWVTTYVLLV